jgi:hypothetical protein
MPTARIGSTGQRSTKISSTTKILTLDHRNSVLTWENGQKLEVVNATDGGKQEVPGTIRSAV